MQGEMGSTVPPSLSFHPFFQTFHCNSILNVKIKVISFGRVTMNTYFLIHKGSIVFLLPASLLSIIFTLTLF